MRCVASVSRAGKSSHILSEEKRKVAWPLDRRWHTRQLGTSLSCMGWSSASHMQGESLTIRQTKGVSLVITKVDLITMIVYCLSGYITNTNGHDRPMVSRNIQPFPAVRKPMSIFRQIIVQVQTPVNGQYNTIIQAILSTRHRTIK